MSMNAAVYAGMIGAIASRQQSLPPVTTWRYWGIEYGVDAGQNTLRVRGMQWNYTPGVHTQDLPSESNLNADASSATTGLGAIYTNSSLYHQWFAADYDPRGGKTKVWGDFSSAVTIRSIGIYAQSFSTYWPATIRHIWSSDAVNWNYGSVVNTPTWITTNYVWFDNGF